MKSVGSVLLCTKIKHKALTMNNPYASLVLDQTDKSTTVPVSFRLPVNINNELEELAESLDRTRSALINEFIDIGISGTNKFLEERSKNPVLETPTNDQGTNTKPKNFIANTNYSHDKSAQVMMLANHEFAAFFDGWREYVCNLSIGDKVYLYQSGVGFIASGTVASDLEKSDYNGVSDAKYSKKLEDFKTGFKAISAKQFKQITGDGTNFRMTLAKMKNAQAQKLDEEIDKRMSEKSSN